MVRYSDSKTMVNLNGMEFNSKQLSDLAKDLNKENISIAVICDMEEEVCTKISIGLIK